MSICRESCCKRNARLSPEIPAPTMTTRGMLAFYDGPREQRRTNGWKVAGVERESWRFDIRLGLRARHFLFSLLTAAVPPCRIAAADNVLCTSAALGSVSIG